MDVKLILHPTDGSENALKALAFACELAAEKKAQLLVLHVQRRHGSERIPRPCSITSFKKALSQFRRCTISSLRPIGISAIGGNPLPDCTQTISLRPDPIGTQTAALPRALLRSPLPKLLPKVFNLKSTQIPRLRP